MVSQSTDSEVVLNLGIPSFPIPNSLVKRVARETGVCHSNARVECIVGVNSGGEFTSHDECEEVRGINMGGKVVYRFTKNKGVLSAGCGCADKIRSEGSKDFYATQN